MIDEETIFKNQSKGFLPVCTVRRQLWSTCLLEITGLFVDSGCLTSYDLRTWEVKWVKRRRRYKQKTRVSNPELGSEIRWNVIDMSRTGKVTEIYQHNWFKLVFLHIMQFETISLIIFSALTTYCEVWCITKFIYQTTINVYFFAFPKPHTRTISGICCSYIL